MHYQRWPPVRAMRFGALEARRASRELIGPSGSRVLDPDVMELLFLLHENDEEMVEYDFIIDKLSPLGVTNYDAITRCISRLQEALGDDPTAPRYVVPVHTVGLRSRSAKIDAVLLRYPWQPWWITVSTAVGFFLLLCLLVWFTTPR